MVLRLPDDYRIDPEDPRAPSQEMWDRMSPEQRDRVVAMLPSEFTLEPRRPGARNPSVAAYFFAPNSAAIVG
ncbi:hypothetical protein [Sorangium sp. So ce233]|uniref:hypothetical protein n=1 Tax=Sorangium sp. So ce233 TaxID=3133290 RepID=UPI003F633379